MTRSMERASLVWKSAAWPWARRSAVDGDHLHAGRLVGGGEGGADGAHPGVVGGDDQAVLVGLEGLAQRGDGARVGRHSADEGHALADVLALGDGAAVVADHRVAQALEHLGRLVALLLGVDHVRLGEHRATPGDGGRLAGALHDVAHVLDVVEQAVGLLVHERAGAGGAVAVGAVVGDAHAAGSRRRSPAG